MFFLNLFKREKILKQLQQVNFFLVATIVIIAIIDLFVLYSAAGGSMTPWAIRQLIIYLVFIPVMLLIAVMDFDAIYNYTYMAYGFCLACLLLIIILGHNAMGATRWLRLGPISFQPSEPMKIILALTLARYFQELNHEKAGITRKLLIPLVIIAIPVGLIADQPDLGTAIVMLTIGAVIIFISGIETSKCLAIGGMGLVTVPIIWSKFLHDYQRKRIINFLNPEHDPHGSGYNIIQSKIAIGSGGLTGRGFLNGTQGQLEFLPEKQTDFIFTMWTEEFGFIGGVALILLYTLIIILSLRTAFLVTHTFGRIAAFGISMFFFLHCFINMAMSMGLMPVVGIPLPLMSYGGTITATTLIAFGILLNLDVNKHAILS